MAQASTTQTSPPKASPQGDGRAPHDRPDIPPSGQARGHSTRSHSEKGLGTLIGDAGRDISRLVSDEVQLAKAETREATSTAVAAMVAIGGGLAMALAALVILLQAVVAALGAIMAVWLASVIVGGVAAVVAYAMVKAGQKKLKPESLAFPRTAANVQRDVETVGHAAQTTSSSSSSSQQPTNKRELH